MQKQRRRSALGDPVWDLVGDPEDWFSHNEAHNTWSSISDMFRVSVINVRREKVMLELVNLA